jgi:DNA topoisomerase-1
MIVIVVESPNKAKAITEYLKDEKEKYVVVSTFGHLRNLEKKSGSVDVEKEFEYHWELMPQWKKIQKATLDKIKAADKLYIASDPDREGEAICWHLMEVLKDNKINVPTERVVFHSISKKDIKHAIENRIQLRMGLVESYLSRIGLDYLFGFSISPLLWHKVPCCKSAGRVQSVSLRLIVERENEILKFKSEKYIKIHAQFKEIPAQALLTELEDEKFENGNIFNKKIDHEKLKSNFSIQSVKIQEAKQNPPAPFITATLQQAASSQLNFSPSQTMQLAQKLFEGFTINGHHVGLITYMRTDSTNISADAIGQIRKKIEQKYGKNLLPSSPNIHAEKIKNAQEAHEAIRPVDLDLEPDKLRLGDDKLESLYRLIWERTLASQSKPCIIEKHSMKIQGVKPTEYKSSIFELKASRIIFKGFKEIFHEEDEDSQEEKFINFDSFEKGQILSLEKFIETDHETQPPKRYSEASLIQQLKNKGIGRPSTYEKILHVLYEREYAIRTKKIISPTQKGFVVTGFLKQFFPEEVQYEFTSQIEEELDDLIESNGKHKEMVQKFWNNLEGKISKAKENSPMEVSKALQNEFPEFFLASKDKCEKCGNNMVLKISKFGAMRGCSTYPSCKNTINIGQKDQIEKREFAGEQNVCLKSGPYGPYVEVASDPIRRIPVPKMWQRDLENLTKEQIDLLVSLPKNIGKYKDEDLILNIGKFGPYVKFKNLFVSIKSIQNIDLDDVYKKIEEKLKA